MASFRDLDRKQLAEDEQKSKKGRSLFMRVLQKMRFARSYPDGQEFLLQTD